MIALISAVGGSLFISGTFALFSPNASTHGHNTVPEAEAAKLPLHIDEEFEEKTLAGDAATGSNMKVDEEFVDPENHCEFCTRVEYIPGSRGIAGFAYGSDDAIDLSGAKKIRFWVMGEEGGEKVKFKVAGKEKDSDDRRNRDSLSVFNTEVFSKTTDEVELKDDWTKYEVELEGADLEEITHAFGMEISKGSGGKSQVVYLKGVVVDDQPADAEFLLTATAEELSDDEEMLVEILSNATTGDTSTTFRFRSNVTGGESPYEYQWDFDDGDERSGRNAVHSFDEPGTYNVTLIVTDDTGLEFEGSIEIEVEEDEVEAPEEEEPAEAEEEGGQSEEAENTEDEDPGETSSNSTDSDSTQNANGTDTGE